MKEKLFRLQDINGNDVLGGSVSLDNVYITAYGSLLKGYKQPKDLEVDEICKKEYSLSGQKRTVYVIIRIS